MAITKGAVTHYWNYFRTLCNRLENTRQYVDHGIENGSLKYGKVNSWEFQQILLLSSMEFENVCKQLCLHFDKSFNVAYGDIKKITKVIQNKYPNIGLTEIETDYQILCPLSNWKVTQANPNAKEYVDGLSWWDDYDNLKHQTYQMFHLATLENAISVLASLMVIELYMMKEITGTVNLSINKPCEYFRNSYASDMICTEEKALPDFQGYKDKNLVHDSTILLNIL